MFLYIGNLHVNNFWELAGLDMILNPHILIENVWSWLFCASMYLAVQTLHTNS